jgi:hypothetical protein
MKLNMLERIMGISIISEYKEGNFITFKTIEGLKRKLFVTEDETKEFELRIEDNRYLWNTKGQEPVEIELTDGEVKLIKDQLLKLDKDDKLNEQHISLYEKFVVE